MYRLVSKGRCYDGGPSLYAHGEDRSMASVKIDLGFGEQAILSERAGSEILAAKHQRDAEAFLRRWPRTRSIHQERDYLRQLRLHVGYNPSDVNPSDASALLRSAVKNGRVTVEIERATKRLGGDGGAAQSTRRCGAITPSRQSFAEMAGNGSRMSASLDDAVSAPKSYSWMQSYADVSADDLIKYLESVIGSTPGEAAAPDADSATPLGDAEPFSLGPDSSSNDMMTVAARGVSERDEGECYEEYERDMDLCNALGGPMGGARGLALCQQNAFLKYQQCRGF